MFYNNLVTNTFVFSLSLTHTQGHRGNCASSEAVAEAEAEAEVATTPIETHCNNNIFVFST